ncbi:putative Calponin homology domain [Blattamonas nauphoetae]|uniref:Calponin homology domain n=1 Tax=Blattamonas nauphoetae TaxID=2049346 RepID=A0ABQ9YL79_9EUKA|nr:putative Calponin homology domain [Blattamonas nauphoetae]
MTEKYELDMDTLGDIYEWVDTFSITRPKKNIARDFSDCVNMAEVAKHLFPKLVDVHNYPPANAVPRKITNWNTFNVKVLKKLGMNFLTSDDIQNISSCVPGSIEWCLNEFKQASEAYFAKKQSSQPSPQQKKISKPDPKATKEEHHEEEELDDQSSEADFDSPSPVQKEPTPPPAPKEETKKQPKQPQKRPLVQTEERSINSSQSVAILQKKHDEELAEKDAAIEQLKDAIDTLSQKVSKMEQMLRLKESRIQTLTMKLQQSGSY